MSLDLSTAHIYTKPDIDFYNHLWTNQTARYDALGTPENKRINIDHDSGIAFVASLDKSVTSSVNDYSFYNSLGLKYAYSQPVTPTPLIPETAPCILLAELETLDSWIDKVNAYMTANSKRMYARRGKDVNYYDWAAFKSEYYNKDLYKVTGDINNTFVAPPFGVPANVGLYLDNGTLPRTRLSADYNLYHKVGLTVNETGEKIEGYSPMLGRIANSSAVSGLPYLYNSSGRYATVYSGFDAHYSWKGTVIGGQWQDIGAPMDAPVGTIFIGEGSTVLPPTGIGEQSYSLVGTRSALNTFFSQFSIPYTFVVNEAENVPTNEFSDYVPAGQPENTTGGGGGGTGTTGGGGVGDNSSDEITIERPAFTNLSTFNKFYSLNRGELEAFANFIWSETFLQDWKRFFVDPAESIIGVQMFPFGLSQIDSGGMGAVQAITVAGITSDVQGKPILPSYNSLVDVGEIELKEYFGNYMDYSPHTDITLFLPYIGYRSIDTDMVMGKTLSIKYAIDMTTGNFSAFVWANAQLIHQFDGALAISIPISSSGNNQFMADLTRKLVSGAARAIPSVLAGAATGGAAGAATAGAKAAFNSALDVSGSKKRVEMGGSFSPYNNLFAPQYAFLTISRPIKSQSDLFQERSGFPTNVGGVISSFSGYTEFSDVEISGITATDAEKQMIIDQLRQGVIIL